ncbi:hypothetical protein PVPAM_110040900 [Plasmodium vivax]|nr:hypothetical protein PVPAM_110040900 [Plasmodium vivax]
MHAFFFFFFFFSLLPPGACRSRRFAGEALPACASLATLGERRRQFEVDTARGPGGTHLRGSAPGELRRTAASTAARTAARPTERYLPPC